VYLLEQQAPIKDAHPRQVALKVPFVGCVGTCNQEAHVMWRMRGGLGNVVQLLGSAQGKTCAQQEVHGLVYEYCPGKDLYNWALDLLQQAAQQPEVRQQYPDAVEAVMAARPPAGWLCPEAWVVQANMVGEHDRPAFYAAYATALRQMYVEQPLKQHMRQLLQLVVKMSRGSSSGHDSATLAPGGRIIHADIKPDNIYMSATGEAKLGDWGLASYFSADTSEPFEAKGLTLE
jgi:serine/threonine protein kinase